MCTLSGFSKFYFTFHEPFTTILPTQNPVPASHFAFFAFDEARCFKLSRHSASKRIYVPPC